MKKNRIIGWIIAGVVFLLIVLIPILSSNNSIYTKINFNEFKKNITNEDFTFIYIGYSDCSFCKQMKPALTSLYNDQQAEILYLDYSKLSSNEKDELKYKTDQRLINMGTPTFLFVREGKIEEVQIGAMDEEEFIELYKTYATDPTYYTVVNAKRFIELFESKQTNVLVIGQTSCGHCTNYKPTLNSVARQYNITINYLEFDVLSDKDKSSVSALDDKLQRFGTPYTLITKNGEIIDEISGNAPASDLVNLLKQNNIIKDAK